MTEREKGERAFEGSVVRQFGGSGSGRTAEQPSGRTAERSLFPAHRVTCYGKAGFSVDIPEVVEDATPNVGGEA